MADATPTPATPTIYSASGGAVIPNSAPQGTPQDTSTPTPDTSTLTTDNTAPSSTPDYATPQYPSPYPVSALTGALTGAAFSNTPAQQTAQDTSDALAGLNEQEAGKAQFTTDQYKALGYGTTTDANGNTVAVDPDMANLQSQLTQLQNEAQAIPLTTQQGAEGRGITAAGLQPVTDAALRRNAISALSVNSLISSKNGMLQHAKDLVDIATTQKFGPIEAEIKAKQSNLDLIKNSPDYTNEEKQQAAAQQAVLTQQANALDIQKQNYTNTQTEVLKYAPFASADQLQQLSQAQTPTQVGQMAASLGLQQPQSGRYTQTSSTLTDAFGNQYQVQHIFDTVLGRYLTPDETAGKTIDQLNSQPGASQSGTYQPSSGTGNANTSSSLNNLAFQQYGNLAKTNFNPNNTVDQLAQKYLDSYIKNGTVPTASSLGRNLKPTAVASIDARARDLYTQATGQPLPNPEIIKGYQAQLIGNNALLNNLNVQEGTIKANSALLLGGLNGSNINQNAPLINGILDKILNTLGDPNVAAYLAQNTTIQSELGSLMAIKNAGGGTTVHDKLEAGNLINKNSSADQIAQVVTKLMQEAVYSHDAIQSASADLYKQTDPLMQDANNPARQTTQNSQFVEQSLTAQGLHYDTLMADMTKNAPAGMQPALDAKTGKPGFATPAEIQAGTAIPL